MKDKAQIEASLKWLENPTPMMFHCPMSPADQLLADGRYLERLIDASLIVNAHTHNRDVLDRIARLGRVSQ